MDFTLDTEQTALRDAVRGLLSSRCDNRAKVVAEEPGYDTAQWGKLADMGVLGLPFPEDHDGMGAGPVEVMLVAEEIGRALAPEPFLDVVVIAGGLVDAAGSDEQRQELLPRISAGTLRPVLAHAEPGARWGTAAYSVTAEQGNDGWTLSGSKEPVLHGASADLLIVSALIGSDTKLFVVDPDQAGVTRVGYATYEGGRAARITFADAIATSLGDEPADSSALDDVFVRATTAVTAEALGVMEFSVATTVDYLKSRKQFGVPLAKFQALTHRTADLYVSLELVRSTVQWATMSLATGTVDPVVASRAKLQASRAGRHVGQESIQLHGGIAMTDEYSIGHYASRLLAIEHTLGDAAYHRARLASGVGDYGIVELLH